MFGLSEINTTVFGVMGANATNAGDPGGDSPAVVGDFTGDTLDTLASGGISLSWTVYQGPGGFGGGGARGVDAVGTPYQTDYPNGAVVFGVIYGPGGAALQGGKGGAGGGGGDATLNFSANTLGAPGGVANDYPSSFSLVSTLLGGNGQLGEGGGTGGSGGQNNIITVILPNGRYSAATGTVGGFGGQGGAGGHGGLSDANVSNIAIYTTGPQDIFLAPTGGVGAQGGGGGNGGNGGDGGNGGNGGNGGAGGAASVELANTTLSSVSIADFTAQAVGGAGGPGGTNGKGGVGITVTDLNSTTLVPASNGLVGNGGAGGNASVTVSNVQYSANLLTISISATSGKGGLAGSATATPAAPGTAGADGTTSIDIENSTFGVMAVSNRGNTLTLGLGESNPLGNVNLNAGTGGNLVFSGNSFRGDGNSTFKLGVTGGGVKIDTVQGQIIIGGSQANSLSGFRTFYLDSNDTIVANTNITVFLSYDPDTVIVEAGHVGGTFYNANATDFILDFQGFNGLTLAQLQADTTTTGGDTTITIDGQSLILANYTGGLNTANTDIIACFCTGTRIMTEVGELPVEQLRPGLRLRTSAGKLVPIRWLGHSQVAWQGMDPLHTLPVRIKAGALGQGLPSRDLLVSPGHAVFLDGLLVHAGALVNGTSIVYETPLPDVFTYWHIELDSHELLLAEGTAAESFLEGAEQFGFDNWHERMAPIDVQELPYPRCKAIRQLPQAIAARLAAWQVLPMKAAA